MTGEAIELRGVTKTFPGASAPAVAPLDLTLGAGEITVLIGPSGCGKTTTMRMINRLIEPSAGSIAIGGVDIRERSTTELRRGIGYVIQQIGLFPHRTVAQNIATVPTLLKWDRARTAERTAELAELVGIDEPMLGRYPAELSGGQQQRVGVARALAADPPVLLMDEPFGAVDPIVRARLQDELLALQARLHKTIVLVTHDIDEAIRLGDRVAVLNVGGVLEQVAAPDDLLADPANDFVAEFVGAEPSIKRLALARVSDLEIGAGPVAPADATAAAGCDIVARAGIEWLGVVDGDRFLGWVAADEVRARATDPTVTLGSLDVRPPAAQVAPDATLREALEVILTARTANAVVRGHDGRFGGILSLEDIRRGLAR